MKPTILFITGLLIAFLAQPNAAQGTSSQTGTKSGPRVPINAGVIEPKVGDRECVDALLDRQGLLAHRE